MRKAIFQIHLYAALVTGVILAVLSVTGCLLVFEKTMDAWVDRKMVYVEPKPQSLLFNEVLNRATAAVPGKSVAEIDVGGPERSIIAVLTDRSRVFVNGYTGEILGIRRSPPMSFRFRQLHRTLLAGKTGGKIVVITTFVLAFQCISGLYLWWPLKRMTVKTTASWRRVNFDLHHSAGFFSSAFLLILAISGLVRHYPEITQKFSDRVQSFQSPEQTAASSKISIDDAAAIARAQLPGSSLVRITMPERKSDPIVVSTRYPGDMSLFGLSWVELDPANGRVRTRQDVRAETRGDRIQRIDRPIHTGEIFGWPTRIAAFVSCLAVLVELATGIAMWWKRPSRRVR